MRTEAIVESFEASLREAFQQLQGGANAIPWWERKSLAQGMTESFETRRPIYSRLSWG